MPTAEIVLLKVAGAFTEVVVVFAGRGVGPLVYVTLWLTAPALHVHVTVPPLCITTALGLKKLLFTVTAADVGGAVAVTVNVTGVERPVNVAVTDCGLVDPMLSVALATPDALVVF